jgi:hypothetical protein
LVSLCLCLAWPLASASAKGLVSARLEAMADDGAPAAPLAAASTAALAPPPDTAHFTVPFNLPGDFTTPYDINDTGTIVGTQAIGAISSGFLYQGGAVTLFDAPAAAGFTELNGVSNRGDAVGDYYDAAGIDRGFLRTADGTIADLPDPLPNFTFNIPSGINSSGVIVGSYTDGPNLRVCVGYVLRKGKYRPLDIPGATCVFPNGINDRGDIVGSWLDTDRISHGFVLLAGERDDDDAKARFVDITIPGVRTTPWRMNERREIVGIYLVPAGRGFAIHSYFQRGADVRTLDDPAGFGTVLTGINKGGVIAGSSSSGGLLAIPIAR